MEKNISFKHNIQYDFTVSHNIDIGWVMDDFHFHDPYEIYLSMSDGVIYYIEGSVYHLKKGDLLIFNNMDLHKTEVSPDLKYERYIITFMPEFIEVLCTDSTDLLECFINRSQDFSYCVHLSDEQLQQMTDLFEKAIYYDQNPIFGADIQIKIILAQILLLVNSLYQSPNTMIASKSGITYKRIKPVIQYISHNLEKNLSLNHLSEKFFISKYHLGYLFKKATGFSINEYIINRRIIKAHELLQKDLSVSKAGELVGYTNVSHFIRTFKKLTGISPKQYAKKERKS